MGPPRTACPTCGCGHSSWMLPLCRAGAGCPPAILRGGHSAGDTPGPAAARPLCALLWGSPGVGGGHPGATARESRGREDWDCTKQDYGKSIYQTLFFLRAQPL